MCGVVVWLQAARAATAGILAFGAAFACAAGWSVDLSDGRQVAIVPDPLAGPGAQHLVRRNPDGSPDQSFGTAGRVAISLGADSPAPQSLRIDASGRILVVGAATGPQGLSIPAALRFMQDGRLDTTWGRQGRTLIATGTEPAFAADALPMRDDSVLVLGQIEAESAEQATLWRLGNDGALDTQFGQAGLLRATGTEMSQAIDLHLDDDGAALVAIQTVRNGLPWLEVHRLQTGQAQPQRVASQPMPQDWQGPVTLGRRGGAWQWFDSSLPITSGGVPLVAVAATETWTRPRGTPAETVAAEPTGQGEGGAGWNPFSSAVGADTPMLVVGLDIARLGWSLLAVLAIAAAVALGWRHWRRR